MSKFNSALALLAASTLFANVAFAAETEVAATTEATTEVTNTVSSTTETPAASK